MFSLLFQWVTYVYFPGSPLREEGATDIRVDIADDRLEEEVSRWSQSDDDSADEDGSGSYGSGADMDHVEVDAPKSEVPSNIVAATVNMTTNTAMSTGGRSTVALQASYDEAMRSGRLTLAIRAAVTTMLRPIEVDALLTARMTDPRA